MARLQLEINLVTASRKRDVHARPAQIPQQFLRPRERGRSREQPLLYRHHLGEERLGGDGEAGPLLQDREGGGAGAALQLGLDAPGERGPAVARERFVRADGVEVFGVEEEAVHVEEAGADGGEDGRCFGWGGRRG